MSPFVLIYIIWGLSVDPQIQFQHFNTKAGCDQTRLFLEKNLADTDEEYNNSLKEDSNYVRRSVDAMCISDR